MNQELGINQSEGEESNDEKTNIFKNPFVIGGLIFFVICILFYLYYCDNLKYDKKHKSDSDDKINCNSDSNLYYNLDLNENKNNNSNSIIGKWYTAEDELNISFINKDKINLSINDDINPISIEFIRDDSDDSYVAKSNTESELKKLKFAYNTSDQKALIYISTNGNDMFMPFMSLERNKISNLNSDSMFKRIAKKLFT